MVVTCLTGLLASKWLRVSVEFGVWPMSPQTPIVCVKHAALHSQFHSGAAVPSCISVSNRQDKWCRFR